MSWPMMIYALIRSVWEANKEAKKDDRERELQERGAFEIEDWKEVVEKGKPDSTRKGGPNAMS